MSDYLVSPTCRRLASKSKLGDKCVQQLLKLGWREYVGPAKVTVSKDKRLSGWVVVGSDPRLDARRLALTGTLALCVER